MTDTCPWFKWEQKQIQKPLFNEKVGNKQWFEI